MSEIINVRLHSKHAKKDESNTYHFDIGRTLSFVHKKAYVMVTQFQALNSIFNITSAKNELLGFRILEGNYSVDTLLPKIVEILKNYGNFTNTVDVVLDKSRMEFVFTSISPFLLSGTCLKLIGITYGASIPVNNTTNPNIVNYIVRSDRPIDLGFTHNIHVCSSSIFVDDTNINDSVSSTLCTFGLNYGFGEFILHNNDSRDRSECYNDFISIISISIKNDDDDDIFINTDFSLTIQFEVFQLDIEKIEMNKMGSISYPVVNRYTSILKDAKQIQLERYNEKMKQYLTSHPLYSWTEKEIKQIKKKKMNLLEELMKKNNKFLL
jgi:hypothetical protein